MKIYHKFLLYQNKWIHPYTRIILGGVTYIAYLASILLIMGVVYEHGFTISEHEASQLQTLYRFVWGVFLSEVTLRLLLPYPYPCYFSSTGRGGSYSAFLGNIEWKALSYSASVDLLFP